VVEEGLNNKEHTSLISLFSALRQADLPLNERLLVRPRFLASSSSSSPAPSSHWHSVLMNWCSSCSGRRTL
jgi:hypothetical protein